MIQGHCSKDMIYPLYFWPFFQSQKRVAGDFKKSIHKFELPGGDNNLIDIDFFIDQERFGRYRSAKQNIVETGCLMKHYRETLSNINALQSSRDLPPFYYKDYTKWNFINAFRTTPVESNLNYIEQLPNIKLPVCIIKVLLLYYNRIEHL